VLSISQTLPFSMTKDPKSARHERMYVRGDTDFVPHLTGIEYKQTSTIFPTDSDLANHNNYQLGRFPDAKMLKAVRIITN
jgi:hypothetical protein